MVDLNIHLHSFIFLVLSIFLFFNSFTSDGCAELAYEFKVFFHVVINAIMFTMLVESVLAIDSRYEACRPKNCGTGPNISYPFWILGNGTDFCGHPGFEVSCEQNKPIYRTSGSHYIIEDISYENQTLQLVDVEVLDTTCLAPRHNFSLDRSPLEFHSPHADLFFFYNCTKYVPINYTQIPVTCASNAYFEYSFVALVPGGEGLNCNSVPCESLVFAPVELEEGQSNEPVMTIDYYTKLLRNGFTLEWSRISCAECVSSGGQCGFSNETLMCFCPDRPHLGRCNDGMITIFTAFRFLFVFFPS